MKNFWTIFRRELGAYFNSSIAYIFLVVFIVFNNGLFMMQFFQIGKADMRLFFNAMPFALTIFIPAISMRLWAEEKRTSTYELLLTLPMRPHELVLGKYLAGFVFFLIALAGTLTIPLMISLIGRVDPGPILGGYAGALSLGALYLAIGIFLSGVSKDQIVAFILTMIATFALYFLGTDLFAASIDGWVPGLGTLLKGTLGATGHLLSFSRGIIDFKDILYFVLLSAVFLFLNGLSLEGRFKPKARAVYSTAVVLALVVAVLANWLLHDMTLGRFDLTQGRIYTISETSLRLLKQLKVPVLVKYYVSPADHMPTVLKRLEQDAQDKLEELKIASGGNFTYRIVHIGLDATEDQKLAYQEQGVVPFQVESIQKDEVGVKLIYSTVTIEYKEKPVELLPRIVPAALFDLEYQLVSRIYKLTLEEKPKVALYAPVQREEFQDDVAKLLEAAGGKEPAQDARDVYKTVSTLIRNNGFDLSRIALTKDSTIPPNTKTLVILAPGALTERQRWEINRYVHEGGTAVIAAQGFEYSFTREADGIAATPKQLSLDLNKLIEKWGVRVSDQVLLDLNSQVISLTTGQRIGPYALEMPVKLPNQIVVSEAMINRASPLTNRLPSLFYLWGSALDVVEDALKTNGLTNTVLFTSSPKSWKIPFDGQNLNAKNTAPPAEFTGRFPLAAGVEGQFPTAFGAASAPAWEEGGAPDAVKLEPKPGRLVVVGCAAAFSEELIQNSGNINLFANLIDGLTLGTDLIEIRSKMPLAYDVRRLSDSEKFWYRFFTVLFIPIVLTALAGGRSFIRKKEKEMYLAARNG